MLEHTLEVLEFEKIKDKLRNYVFSGLGKSKINEIIFYKKKEDIQKALKETSQLAFLLKNTNFPPLGIYDIREELRRARMENSYLYPEDLIKCSSTLRAMRMLKNYILSNKDDAPSLSHFADELNTFKHIEDEIEKAIDDNYTVKDTASKELGKIRIQIISYKSRIEKKLNDLLRNRDYSTAIQEEIITSRENRYVIPIKKDYKGRISGIVLDTSNSGNTLFVEPSIVVEDNNTLMALIVEEKQEEIRILKKITALITDKWKEISNNLKILGEFEFLYAKSRLSIDMKCNEVEVNDEGLFRIYKARHPLLEGEVVPVDLIIGKDYRMLIITGPNTGGKSVSLKNFGLLTLMVSAGIPIPASIDSQVSTVDNIYTDIGDEQSISQNLSTFSSHIKRISKILKMATNRSLVLIDEIGAGTDPREGSAIGIAVLEELLKRNSTTVVTTHFTKIKNFALRKQKVETASCEFDIDTLSPTYRIIYGIPGESNAITIAKRLGLHWSIVKRANQLFIKDNDKSDSIIKTLTDEKIKYTKLLEIYEQKIKEITHKDELIREKEQELLEKEKKLKKEQLGETMNIIQNARKEVLNLIKEAKASVGSKNSTDVGKVMGEIEKISSEIKNVIKEEQNIEEESEFIEDADGEIKEGDSVLIKTLGKIGSVIQIGKKSDITVQVGGIKFVLSKSDLVKQIEKKKNGQLKKSDIGVSITTTSEIFETPPFELNLIGLRGEEAVKKSEQYIEALHYYNRELGRIVHGKGEGILRKLITEMLKNHPYVKSFRPAHINEGGHGVTEVLIKLD